LSDVTIVWQKELKTEGSKKEGKNEMKRRKQITEERAGEARKQTLKNTPSFSLNLEQNGGA
jgi:hypothetical protein